MLGLFPVCRDVTALVAEGELERAAWLRRLLVRLHLALCEHCRRFARQLDLIGGALREHWSRKPGPKALDELERRILARLRARGGS